MSAAIILSPLTGIPQDTIGLIQTLEITFCLRLAGPGAVHVGVQLQRKAPEGCLDLLLGGGRRHAKGGIIAPAHT